MNEPILTPEPSALKRKGNTIEFTKGDRPPADRRRPKRAEPSTEPNMKELFCQSMVRLDSHAMDDFFSFCDGLSNILYSTQSMEDELDTVRNMIASVPRILDVLTKDAKELIRKAEVAHQKLGDALRTKGLID